MVRRISPGLEKTRKAASHLGTSKRRPEYKALYVVHMRGEGPGADA